MLNRPDKHEFFLPCLSLAVGGGKALFPGPPQILTSDLLSSLPPPRSLYVFVGKSILARSVSFVKDKQYINGFSHNCCRGLKRKKNGNGGKPRTRAGQSRSEHVTSASNCKRHLVIVSFACMLVCPVKGGGFSNSTICPVQSFFVSIFRLRVEAFHYWIRKPLFLCRPLFH